MKNRRKSILIFIGGLVSGVLLTFLWFAIMASNSSNDDLYLFDTPEREIPISSFRVIQVVNDGNALAVPTDVSHYGTVVLFLRGNGMSYYDAQHIEVPYGKRLMQVGTYRYVARDTTMKTIPVVQIMDM